MTELSRSQQIANTQRVLDEVMTLLSQLTSSTLVSYWQAGREISQILGWTWDDDGAQLVYHPESAVAQYGRHAVDTVAQALNLHVSTVRKFVEFYKWCPPNVIGALADARTPDNRRALFSVGTVFALNRLPAADALAMVRQALAQSNWRISELKDRINAVAETRRRRPTTVNRRSFTRALTFVRTTDDVCRHLTQLDEVMMRFQQIDKQHSPALHAQATATMQKVYNSGTKLLEQLQRRLRRIARLIQPGG